MTILPKTGSFADTNMLVGLGLIISTIGIGLFRRRKTIMR
ncbi:LPXTG cell wall anchor domain-containing protein [Neobacillus niacini]